MKPFLAYLIMACSLSGALAGSESPATEVESGHLIRLGPMHEIRASHSATLLPDGKVLLAGGFRKGPDGSNQIYSRSAELFDPATSAFVPTGEMNTPRCGHSAVLLPNGTVLLAGGFTRNGQTASAEIYDPHTGKFTSIKSMSAPRGDATATLLTNGDVLIAGGGDIAATATAEIYRAETMTFGPTGSMHVPRISHSSALLPGGEVLITGGMNRENSTNTAEVYDPRTGTFTIVGSMNVARCKHASVLLNDGTVLIVGGGRDGSWRTQERSAEVFNSRTGKFEPVPPMAGERFKLPGAIVRLRTGDVLVAGGNMVIELFEAKVKRFRDVDKIGEARYFSTATALPNGTTLLTGGYTTRLQATDDAWLYRE
jgi:hypothetical protein